MSFIVRFPRLHPSSSHLTQPSSKNTSIALDANSSDLLVIWEHLSARVAALIVVHPSLARALVVGVERLLNRLRL